MLRRNRSSSPASTSPAPPTPPPPSSRRQVTCNRCLGPIVQHEPHQCSGLVDPAVDQPDQWHLAPAAPPEAQPIRHPGHADLRGFEIDVDPTSGLVNQVLYADTEKQTSNATADIVVNLAQSVLDRHGSAPPPDQPRYAPPPVSVTAPSAPPPDRHRPERVPLLPHDPVPIQPGHVHAVQVNYEEVPPLQDHHQHAVDQQKHQAAEEKHQANERQQQTQDIPSDAVEKLLQRLKFIEHRLEDQSRRSSRSSSRSTSAGSSRRQSRASSPSDLLKKVLKRLVTSIPEHAESVPDPPLPHLPPAAASHLPPAAAPHPDRSSQHLPLTAIPRQQSSGEYDLTPSSVITDITIGLWHEAVLTAAQQPDLGFKTIKSWAVLSARTNVHILNQAPTLTQENKLNFMTFLANLRVFFVTRKINKDLFLVMFQTKCYPVLQTFLSAQAAGHRLTCEHDLIKALKAHLYCGLTYPSLRPKLSKENSEKRARGFSLANIAGDITRKQAPLLAILSPLAEGNDPVPIRQISRMLIQDMVHELLTPTERRLLGAQGLLAQDDLNRLISAQGMLDLYKDGQANPVGSLVNNVDSAIVNNDVNHDLADLFNVPNLLPAPAKPPPPGSDPVTKKLQLEIKALQRKLATQNAGAPRPGSAAAPPPPSTLAKPSSALPKTEKKTRRVLCRSCVDAGRTVPPLNQFSCNHCFFHSVDGLFQDLSTCPDSRCQINFLKVTAGKERQAKKEAEK